MRLLLTFLIAVTSFAEDWPEWRGKGRRGEFNESGILDVFPASGLKVKWRTPVRSGYSGPSVAAGRVFVTDFRVLKSDEGPPLGVEMNIRRASGRQGRERALALDEKTGKVLW